MFLRAKTRKKDGKEHRYWSVVENRRVADGRVVQRHVLYLGEINDAQRAAWCRSIAVFDEDAGVATPLALFPEDRPAPALACAVVQVKLSELQLRRPRQWGACWLACGLWDLLQLDAFWAPRLLPSRKGTRWLNVLKTLVAYRLIDPGSECVQVVIALIVTPDGFPLAYEVLAGNTLDKQTLTDFLAKIDAQYGKADRIWVMDRGIPTEDTLALMRAADPPVHYLVGTPKGRLTQLEKSFLTQPWTAVRDQVTVKLLKQDGELYVLALSAGRQDKERAMRRRRLKRLCKRLQELQGQTLSRDDLLLKLGAAKKDAGRAYGLLRIQVPAPDEPVTAETFTFALNRKKLRQVRRREGCYVLRSNLTSDDPGQLWTWYIQLTEVEQAFKELKGDLRIRPIYHQRETRIEAHIFVAFLAYCLQVTLKARLRPLAPGLTPRSVLEKFGAIQMVDVHLPTTDGRTLILSRYTEPEPDQQLLLDQLHLQLPAQPPPRITAALQASLH